MAARIARGRRRRQLARFHWLTFSSVRAGSAQPIYFAPVVDDGIPLITYPARYPWNQVAGDVGHTSAWGNSAIPP